MTLYPNKTLLFYLIVCYKDTAFFKAVRRCLNCEVHLLCVINMFFNVIFYK